MVPKQCAQCRHLFAARESGLAMVFCQPCIGECENAYLKIRRYLQDHPSAPAPKITLELGIPAVFVYHLFRIGRFAPDLSRRSAASEQRRPCSLCRRLLQQHEEVYCAPCNIIVEKRMHTRYNQVAAPKDSPLKSPTRSARSASHHYGFGRSMK